jgi:hypothetical protein
MAPTFRPLVAGDIPGTLNPTTVSGATPLTVTATTGNALVVNAATGYNGIVLTTGGKFWDWYISGANHLVLWSDIPDSSGMVMDIAPSSVTMGKVTGIGAAPAAGYDLDVTASAPNGGTAHFAGMVTITPGGSFTTLYLIPTVGNYFVSMQDAVTGKAWSFLSAGSNQLALYSNAIPGTVLTFSPTAPNITISGSTNFTVIPTSPTPTAGDNSTKVATTAFVTSAVSGATGTAGMWFSPTLTANLVAPNNTAAHWPGYMSVPAGMLVDLSASTGDTLLDIK